MTDFQTLTKLQPTLASLGPESPYVRLVSQDRRTVADVEYRDASEASAAEIQVAVVERDAADNAAPVVAAVFDAATGKMLRYGSTVSSASSAAIGVDSVADLAAAVGELVACPATAGL